MAETKWLGCLPDRLDERVRVVYEGPVSAISRYGFTLGDDLVVDGSLDVEFTNRLLVDVLPMAGADEVDWRDGDYVIDGRGVVLRWCGDTNARGPWRDVDTGLYVPDETLMRPLALLVRDGKALRDWEGGNG